MYSIDQLDWKILSILDWNGRIPLNTLAKMVRSNKDVVAYRIKKLEEQRIIVRYYPVVDMAKLGYHTIRLYFDLEEMSASEEVAFVAFLDKDIGAGLIFRMDYPYRYGILHWVKSVYDVNGLIQAIKQKLGKRLTRYNHTLFYAFKLYPRDYLFGKKFHEKNFSFQPREKGAYDSSDFTILKELSHNARLSTVKIAHNIGIPQTTVSSKIRAMEKRGIILGYRADIDFIKLGYINYFLEMYLDTNENITQIEAWADAHRNVMWLQKIIGTCDLEIEVEVKDRAELEQLLNELRTRFANIRKIVFWSQEYKKWAFLPE